MDATEIVIECAALKRALVPGAVLLDAREPETFRNGHIPGALPFSTCHSKVDDSSIEGMRKFAQKLADRFSSVGVRLDRPVVVYDEDTGMRAARELWMLEFIGHRKARILHGGLSEWKAKGGLISTNIDLTTVRPTKIEISVASGCHIPIEELARRSKSPMLSVIDVRNDLEWAGEHNSTCCKRNGHVPHAVHIEWTQFLADGRFRGRKDILALLEANSINPHNEIAVYSNHGGRAANTYYALKVAGVSGARNAIGSWHEWSSREDLPVSTAV
jgi:thiosulfate/3-mercaptopyruvate sulfurtransferase